MPGVLTVFGALLQQPSLGPAVAAAVVVLARSLKVIGAPTAGRGVVGACRPVREFGFGAGQGT